MAYQLPLTAVGDAAYALFQDPTLQALTATRVFTDVPENPDYPFLWFEVLHQANEGGLGTQPGRGSMPHVTLRLHVFQGEGGAARDAQLVMARAIQLLFPADDATASLTLDGYTLCSNRPLPEIETIPLADEELNGVKVQELVTNVDLVLDEVVTP
jgi:hypothetical protein